MEVVSPILNLISTPLLAQYARISGISDKLEAWGRKLRMIQAVMDSAEVKQMNGDPAIDHWLSELRDVAYDMEDLLCEFSVDAKRNTSKVQAVSRSSKFPACLVACCCRIDPRTLISEYGMANVIEEVDRRLEEVFSYIPVLGLVQNHRGGASSSPPRAARFTTSLPEPKFVGREKQMKELLARLIGSEATDNSTRPFNVVSIVGMGGLGKTTLAQQLYCHESLNDGSFPVKAWVCVSDIFDRVSITKRILDQVASSGMENDLNKLQNLLKEKLSGKKFLIVLDDVWNDSCEELESLLTPLDSGSKGSRILLTTRNIQVARMIGDNDPRRLDLLSPEESLSLLAYHSIGEENFERHPQLQDVAVQLVEKCKGLPLSIKAIGRLLRSSERDDELWKSVLANSIWNKEDGSGTIPTALKLSYVHLPLHLKRCFAAFALFPKDYIFDQDEVIQVWIVQGLLHRGTRKTYRDAGMDNLRHLESASLIERAKDEKTSYSMHDLFNELAKLIMVGVYFSPEESRGGSFREGLLGKTRHSMMVSQQFETFLPSRFDVYRSMKKLRTFILSPTSRSRFLVSYVIVPQEVLHGLIMDKKNLRMLSLRCLTIDELPNRIGELKLLRSIDLSHTFIEVLPESICDLVELQSLLLRWCRQLKELPRNIHKLTKLLHLDIRGTEELTEMPPRIGELTNLEILSDFIVGNKVGLELKNLGPLKCLQRELHLRNLQAIDDVADARIANLREKEAILELSYDWGSSLGTSSGNSDQLTVLEHLQPPKKVESLTIQGYGGKRFASWFGDTCMNKVVSITLNGCKSVLTLPTFGRLPSLESLEIRDLQAVSSVGEEFYGTERPFQSLKRLWFENMEAWERWSSYGYHEEDKPFPRLRNLKVKKCPNLTECPVLSLPSLVEIDIDGCNEGLLNCLTDLTSMTKMDIRKVSELVHFDGRFSASWVVLKEMRIRHCPQLKSFRGEEGRKQASVLNSPNETGIVDCGTLSSFPNSELPPALRELTLRSCPSLPPQLTCSSLPESLEELYLKKLHGLVSITGLPAEGTHLCRSLRVLEIRNCERVTTLPESLQHLSALSELVVKRLPSLEIDCFPALPGNLSSFVLKRCPKVKSLPRDMQSLKCLKTLSITFCNGITRLTSGGLPPNLEVLTVRVCRNLNQPIEDWGLRGLTALQELKLCGKMECVDEMECFPPSPMAWSQLFPPSLAKLVLQKMKKLERVGCGLKAHLTSFRDLWISECPRMKYLPDDGSLSPLERLGIISCPMMEKRLPRYWPLIQHIPDLKIRNFSNASESSSGASSRFLSPDSLDSSCYSDGLI